MNKLVTKGFSSNYIFWLKIGNSKQNTLIGDWKYTEIKLNILILTDALF